MSTTAPETEGWRAKLALRFAARDDRTYLLERSHSGPLLVQRAFYPEAHVCHVYVVHPPGGVVGGDDLRVHVEAEPQSEVLLTTPAATKFYRSDGCTARQTHTLVANDAVLEWLPQESIFYPGAQVRSLTRIDLTSRARFIGWEISCLGLPARDEEFSAGELHLHLELYVDCVALLIDRLRIFGGDDGRRGRWGLNAYDAIGTMLAYPATRATLEALRAVDATNAEYAATLVDDVLVCRCLAAQAEPIKRVFIDMWHVLRQRLLGRPAVVPRIWAT